MDNIDYEARKQSQFQWNTNPCGQVEGDKNTLAYFEDVEKERYRQQYWQLDHFNYKGFKNKKVLEIGVGHGTDILQFAKGGAICYGIDITDKHIELVQTNFRLRGYELTVKKSDATKIDFPDNYFDCVYSFGVLHHIPEIEMCISEVHRVLKPSGTFYMALYHKYSFGHLFLLLRKGIMKGKLFSLGYQGMLSLVEKGADGVQIKPYVKLYTRKSVRKVLKNKFDVKNVAIRQVFFLVDTVLNRLRIFDKLFGWYVVSEAKKK
jgi:ubiquinone/menaquinone biosynthesis C-methylase UbiE